MRASGPRAPIGLSIGLHAYEEAAVTRRERSQVAPVVTCVALPVPVCDPCIRASCPGSGVFLPVRPRVPCVSRVCPGSPRCLFTGSVQVTVRIVHKRACEHMRNSPSKRAQLSRLSVLLASSFPSASALAAPSPLLFQQFGSPQPSSIGDWTGSESLGIAGSESRNIGQGGSRRLHLLTQLMSAEERRTLLVDLEGRQAAFDTALDTVDAQATFMCRVVEGGETMDGVLAAHVAPVCARLQAFVQERFGSASACVSDVLIRRYLPTERRRLEAHFDVSSFATAIVSLSAASAYEGGLYVQAVPGVPSRRYVQLEAGDALLHRFDTMHGVHVPSGERLPLIPL